MTKTIKLRKKKINESTINPITKRNSNNEILSMLETLVAEELLAWYQYWIPLNFMNGQDRKSIEEEFRKHADEELNDHATKLLKRISELGGDASSLMNFEPKNLSNCQYIVPQAPYSTLQLVCDNIKAEKCAIEHYLALCDYTREKDPTTYELAVDILADEEEHLKDLEDFYQDITGESYSDEEENVNNLIFISKELLNNMYR